MEDYVRLREVKKIYKMGEVEIAAADGIDFSVGKGEFAVVVGASGAGKTTVLNILGGMDTATSGEVIVDGNDITTYNTKQLTAYRRDDIGFVFQFYNLVPNLTALENVELALRFVKILWMRWRCLRMSDWENERRIFRRSFPAESSREFLSQGRWQKIRNCYFAMSQRERWITIQEKQY